MIMIMHRLKRLIGSFYHQKRIDIIITDNAHYVWAEGQWVASYYYQHWTNWDLFINYLARIVRVECNGAKTGSGSWDTINAPFKVPLRKCYLLPQMGLFCCLIRAGQVRRILVWVG